ncbi:hypothetical protein PI95_005115 [Hassallia byssoidea VB512170]|uniref:Uncharacterized protein n=1 Tax=Hassallia byssoidea VB512170 TaxID=1304833 RepID=A0A846H3K3_9CYAN|nr:hypothetical protein [Hassalia byssoidea]NEU71972.1 hypothetical protein [Hassalia byssoidea VB512170]
MRYETNPNAPYSKDSLFFTGAIAVTVEIDQLIADWRNKVNIAGQNLLELQELPTYQRLCGSFGFPPVKLTGITQTQVTPALEAMNDLFQHFDLLVQTVDKAIKLRQQLPRFLSTQKISEITQLLTGASIELPMVQTPLSQRELLTGAETTTKITPAQLLEVMQNAFSVARDAVLAVDDAWTHLDVMLADAEAQIFSLQNLAISLNQDCQSELIQAASALAKLAEGIASLRQSIEQDPLGTIAVFQQHVQPMLADVKATLDQAIRQQNQIREKLAIAHNLLQQLKEIHLKAIAAFAECPDKVLDHSILLPCLPKEQIEALRQWLMKLETKFAEGLVNPIIVGLDNWTIKAKEYIASEQQAYAVNNAPLQTRRELRGRLDALQAKALARQLIEDPILTELALQAKQLLYSRPTPLNKAAELISQYEKRLNG